MKYGDRAELYMKKSILIEGIKDTKKVDCCVLKYDPKEESIYLLLDSELLENVSLDGLYECKLYTKNEMITCIGTVKERFQNEHGKILKFQIKNGFYKINVKSVDKQMT